MSHLSPSFSVPSPPHLWVGQLAVLQRGHVAPEPELLAVEPLEVVLPLHDLALDLRLATGVRHHRHLQLRHVLQLLLLQEEGRGTLVTTGCPQNNNIPILYLSIPSLCLNMYDQGGTGSHEDLMVPCSFLSDKYSLSFLKGNFPLKSRKSCVTNTELVSNRES